MSVDHFIQAADAIRATLDSPGAYPLGREVQYAQMLGNAESALRQAAKLLGEHRECMPRADVEEILKSKLPCGHPDACGTSNATGSIIRCLWCDEVNELKKKLGDTLPPGRLCPPVTQDDGLNEHVRVWWNKMSHDEHVHFLLANNLVFAPKPEKADADYREPMSGFKCTRCGMSYTSFPPAECPLCHNTLDQVTA